MAIISVHTYKISCPPICNYIILYPLCYILVTISYISLKWWQIIKHNTNSFPLTQYRFDDDQTSGSAVTYSLTMPLALAFLSSSFLVFPLQERESKAKQVSL